MMTQILAGLFLLGFCVFFHELGHYLFGRLVGVRAKIFSIGYGKGRLKKKVGDTTYQITAIPLGGYVQFYGDDITQKHEKVKPGDFFSVGPWKRILIALGGPLFSVLLGLAVIFVLISFGWQPITNEVRVMESSRPLPASKVLKNGDRIVSVNGHTTKSFEEITYRIALASEPNIKLKVERDGRIIERSVVAKSFREGDILQIGIRPEGKRYLTVQADKKFNADVKLLEDDKLIKANGAPLGSTLDLRKVTDQNMSSTVRLTVLRQKSPLWGGDSEKEMVLSVPVKEVEYFAFENIHYPNLKHTEKRTEVGPWYKDNLSIYRLEDESYSRWDEFKKAVTYHLRTKGTNRLKLIEGKEPIEATISLQKRGMLGVHLSESLEPKRAELPTDLLSLFTRTYEQTVFTTKSTLVGLYRIFQGKLSFRQSVSGPIKIFDYARRSVTAGWDVYWFLLANITIILGIMNLLPIPVLDGGHVLIYLIEGVYKPLPLRVISLSVRAGFITLLSLGVYVIFIDIWDVLLKRFF